jgi:hypothetical protein
VDVLVQEVPARGIDLQFGDAEAAVEGPLRPVPVRADGQRDAGLILGQRAEPALDHPVRRLAWLKAPADGTGKPKAVRRRRNPGVVERST